MDELEKLIYYFINEQITNIKCCSRLLHKNIVYHVSTIDNEYAIKFFYSGENRDIRFQNEILMYNYFRENNILQVSQILDIIDTICGKVVITNWIEGESLKTKLKRKGLDYCYNDINNMIGDMEKTWLINDTKLKNILSIDKLGISNRFNILENKVLFTIIKNKPNIDFTEIIDVYNYLKSRITPNFNYIINSDVSTHEYLITNSKAYWIDFENFKLGNPNNDLARAFQSLTNTIYNNNNTFYKIFSIFNSNKFYKSDIFLYYLTEKLFSTIYTAKDEINDEEIKFYIDFIIQNFYKIYNNNESVKNFV